MRYMKNLLAMLYIALLPLGAAIAANSPVYQNGLLTIPSVNTPETAGKYQHVTFKLTDQGTWQLLGGRELGVNIGVTSLMLPFMQAAEVTVIKTDSFPVQVFLRINAGMNPCSSLGQIIQRRENNRFDVTVTVQFDYDSRTQSCGASFVPIIRTIPLNVYGLGAGTYSYDINGIKGVFELTADNKYSGDQ